MIYLDSGATSVHKPPAVLRAVIHAMETCANPGRGGYEAAMEAAKRVYACREAAAGLFDCQPEQVVLTSNCTHSLNIAIRSLVKPGGRVVISGFEHNAVTRPLHVLEADVHIAGRKLFCWEDTLEAFRRELRRGADAAVFTHVSNVFGYILPIGEIASMCREFSVPFVLDAAQSAGTLPVHFRELGASFIAAPGHKGLLGPQGTGLLICGGVTKPLLMGGTGTQSVLQDMPEELPERLEAGTVNVPGAAGLTEGIRFIQQIGLKNIYDREHTQLLRCCSGLEAMGYRVFRGRHQAGTVSFIGAEDCEELAEALGAENIAVRAGLHCAPLAHESAGTLESGTVRVSFGYDASTHETEEFLRILKKLKTGRKM